MKRSAWVLLVMVLAWMATVADRSYAAPAAGEIRIVKMVLAKDDGHGRNGQQVKGFGPKDNPLHCVVLLSRGELGTRIRFRWIVVRAGKVKNYVFEESVFATEDDGTTVANKVSLARDWPPGKYRVMVSVEGSKKAVSLDFVIK